MKQDYAMMVLIVGTGVFILFALALIVFLIVHKKKQFRNLMEKQRMEKNLLESKFEVQEQSFKYFSEEIHDNVGQLLSLVKLQLYKIRNTSTEPQIIYEVSQSTELLGKAITDLRNISHTLNSAYINKEGLAEAIEKELAYVHSAKNTLCSFDRFGEEYSLGNEKELLIFRIVQESIANALKHASPTAIEIILNYQPHGLSVLIKDNGTGFDMNNINSKGIGLNNMQVRATLLKGKLDIISTKEYGTSVHLDINHTPQKTEA
jgi:hypothetical protein